MRLKLLLILFFTVGYSAQAQNYFIMRASKDSLDGHLPFYDEDESKLQIMVSIDPKLDMKQHKLSYAIRNRSILNSMLDLYGKSIPVVQSTFDYTVPINDTFIYSGNYRLILRLATLKDTLLQEVNFDFQTLRKRNNYYKRKKKNTQLIAKRARKTSVSHIDIEQTFVNKYDLKRIKANILALGPLVEKAEESALNGIIGNDNIEELRRFFYNFWHTRNPQYPETEWKEYADKLNYCRRNFAYGAYKGYDTDMGRIYLRYGPPNRKVKASNEKGARPYEIWFYSELDKYTNLNILFSQISSMPNERRLLHSNNPGFYFNTYWVQQLFTDTNEQYNRNSHRVYDFFK